MAALVLCGCASTASTAPAPKLPPNGPFDYQLGAPYDPPSDVVTVVRDSTAGPLPGAYNVCYVNAFQTQPGEARAWRELLLLDGGAPVADPGWPDEFLLDTSRDEARDAIAERLASVFAHCADAGFDAVEFDNLDSFERSDGALTPDDNAALATRLITKAHSLGLAAAQKNTAELLGDELDFDFAIVEECGAFDECAVFEERYERVLDIEYDAEAFAKACEANHLPDETILRDIELSAAGSEGYVYKRCDA